MVFPACNPSAEETGDRKTPGVCCLVSVAYLASSRPMRVYLKNQDGQCLTSNS